MLKRAIFWRPNAVVVLGRATLRAAKEAVLRGAEAEGEASLEAEMFSLAAEREMFRLKRDMMDIRRSGELVDA